MRATHWIVIIALFAINNVLLIWWFNREPFEGTAATMNDSSAAETQLGANTGAKIGPDNLASSVAAQQALTDQRTDWAGGIEAQAFAEAYQNFAQTEEYADLWYRLQRDISRQHFEQSNRYQQMSAEELYASFLGAVSDQERDSILGALQMGKLMDLDVLQIKEIYDMLDDSQNYRTILLNTLVERGDAQALEQAKQLILNPADAFYLQVNELVTAVFDKDPDFIRDYFSNLSLDDIQANRPLLWAMSSNKDLAQLFLQNNIDNVLEVEVDASFAHVGASATLDLSRRQQRKIVDMMDTANPHRRHFAQSLVGNFTEPDLIREAFSRVDRPAEQKTFLFILMRANTSGEMSAVARELAAQSDDESIRRLATRR